MKRIAYVITDLNYGGAQTMLLQLLKYRDLEEYNIEVFVREKQLGTAIEDEIVKHGIKCHFLDLEDNLYTGIKKFFHKARNFIKFKRVVDSFRPDIVHAHLESFYSALYCSISRTRYIFTIHSFPDRILTIQFKLLLNILRKKKQLSVVGCARCVTDRFIDLCGNKFLTDATTIYNPIDREKYAIYGERKGNTFIHVGRMEAIKNQKFLIESFAEFAKTNCEARLLMVGDGPLRSDLEALTKELGLEKTIEFLGNRKDVEVLLSQSDCFVLTSKSECCPMSVLEALASGIPIISTNVGGVSEIASEATLFVADKKDCANAFCRIYQSEVLRTQLGDKARLLSKNYDSKTILNQYTMLY